MFMIFFFWMYITTYCYVSSQHRIGYLIVKKPRCLWGDKKNWIRHCVNDRDICRPRWHEQCSTASAEFVKRNLFVITDRYTIRSSRYVESSVVNTESGYGNISVRYSPLFASVDKRLAVNVVSDTWIFDYTYEIDKTKDKDGKLKIRYV